MTEPLSLAARAALAQPEPQGPTDEQIMELMPQQMHEDLAAAARALAEQAGTDSRSATGVMRIMLNRHTVDLARAVLARWGRTAIKPVPVAERLPGAEDVEPKLRYCWWYEYKEQAWYYCDAAHCDLTIWTHWLPHHALPMPQQEADQ